MNINEIKTIACSTFSKLRETIKRDNCYNYKIQISTSDNNKVYVGFCTIIHTNSAILHEEYDMFPELDNTRVVSNDFIIGYIKNMNDIVFVGLQEYLDPDENLVVYYNK